MPRFVSAPEDIVTAKSGCECRLVCRAQGQPTPRVRWYKKGKLVKKDKQLQNQRDEEMDERQEVVSEVTLSEVSMANDEGQYLIEATNDAGHAKHEFEIEGIGKYLHDMYK